MRSTRFQTMEALRDLLGPIEETEILIDWLQDAWQTYDVLMARVGRERARHIITTADLFSEMVTESDTAVDYQSTDVLVPLP